MSREKQVDIDIAVEEMASAIREIMVKCGKCEYYKDGSCLKPIDVGCDINEDILNECDALYNRGYRKQSEIIRCKDCAFGEIDAEGSGSVQCQNRDTPWRRYKEEFVMSPHDYCSYARAKMKGGE